MSTRISSEHNGAVTLTETVERHEVTHLSKESVDVVFRYQLDRLTANCHWENRRTVRHPNGEPVLVEHYDDHPHNGDAMYRDFDGSEIQRAVIETALALKAALGLQRATKKS